MSLPNPGMDFTAFDTLPAASLDDMVENIEALADGSGLNDGAITNAKLNLTGSQVATVATSQTTTSTTQTDLATVGPAVTVTVGASGMVLLTWGFSGSTNVAGAANIYCGIAVSGANTIAASITGDTLFAPSFYSAGVGLVGTTTRLFTGLTPGSTTFTMKYSVSSGIATISNRRISAIPL